MGNGNNKKNKNNKNNINKYIYLLIIPLVIYILKN
jgi:hypothetical protein